MRKYLQITTTTRTKKEAQEISRVLVEKHLAACVQVLGPITSTYRWKGKIEVAKEWLCLIKSKKNLFRKVEKTIKEIHSYEVPEIIATPVIGGSKDYLAWLENTEI